MTFSREHKEALRQRIMNAAGPALLVAFLLVWQLRTSGSLGIANLLYTVAFAISCHCSGLAFRRATSSIIVLRGGPATTMLIGILTFCTVLFVVALGSPLGVVSDAGMVAAASILLATIGRERADREDVETDEVPGLLCIALGGAAATIWCQDIQPPMVVKGSLAVFRAWPDLFFHVREISAFAQSHGLGSLADIRFAGAPAQAYHFASYLIPAAATAVTGMSALDSYAAFLLPIGILVSALGAYALIASFWGAWPGLAAAFTVVVLPDSFFQGFGNRTMGFYFLSQVNVASLYGLGVAALAWVFVIEGCRNGRYLSVAIGYFFLSICLFFKAHIFVANSFILMIYPCLFFSRLNGRVRAGLGVLFTIVFLAVVGFSQHLDRVPEIRLDGSGLAFYVGEIVGAFEPGLLRDFFERVLIRERHSSVVAEVVAAIMIAVTTFGIWLVATPTMIVVLRKRISIPILGFLLLVVMNYFVMSLGLALNKKGAGAPEELLNRPLVWAYFVVAAWTAGAFVYWLQSKGSLRTARVKLLTMFVVVAGSSSLVVQARDLQTLPAWNRGRYEDFNAAPVCLVRAALYVRQTAAPRDLVQDSENDPFFRVTSLSERQGYVADGGFGDASPPQERRIRELASLNASGDGDALVGYALTHGIGWYLMRPALSRSLPESFRARNAYRCDDYLVFRIAPGTR